MSASESDVGTRKSAAPPLAQRRRRVDLEVQAHAVDHAAAVLLGLQVVVDDPRARVRDRRAQRHLAAARRLHDRRAERVGVVERHAEELLVQQHPAHVELDVGRLEAVAGADERAALAAVGGDRPAALGLVLRERLGRRERDQAALVGEDDEAQHQVVLEVLADRQVVEGTRSCTAANIGRRADAGELQELRRVVGAGAEDHLALGADRLERAVADRLDADRARALEEDPVHARVGEHLDVAALDRRVAGRRPPSSSAGRRAG